MVEIAGSYSSLPSSPKIALAFSWSQDRDEVRHGSSHHGWSPSYPVWEGGCGSLVAKGSPRWASSCFCLLLTPWRSNRSWFFMWSFMFGFFKIRNTNFQQKQRDLLFWWKHYQNYFWQSFVLLSRLYGGSSETQTRTWGVQLAKLLNTK